EVDARGAGAPDVGEVRQRAGARILPRLVSGPDERRVHEHRQRILLLARGGDGLRVAREVPRHEDFLAAGTRPEDLRPAAALLAPGGEPRRAELRSERVVARR